MDKHPVEAQAGNLFSVLKRHVGQYRHRGASKGNFRSVKPLICSMALLLVVCGIATTRGDDDESKSGLGPKPVNLGLAGTFTILSKTGITNVYPSAIVGDVGTSPITGAALLLTCGEVLGDVYTVDAAGPLPCSVTDAKLLRSAVGDMQFAGSSD